MVLSLLEFLRKLVEMLLEVGLLRWDVGAKKEFFLSFAITVS